MRSEHTDLAIPGVCSMLGYEEEKSLAHPPPIVQLTQDVSIGGSDLDNHCLILLHVHRHVQFHGGKAGGMP
jgi:hypothetical protein